MVQTIKQTSQHCHWASCLLLFLNITGLSFSGSLSASVVLASSCKTPRLYALMEMNGPMNSLRVVGAGASFVVVVIGVVLVVWALDGDFDESSAGPGAVEAVVLVVDVEVVEMGSFGLLFSTVGFVLVVPAAVVLFTADVAEDFVGPTAPVVVPAATLDSFFPEQVAAFFLQPAVSVTSLSSSSTTSSIPCWSCTELALLVVAVVLVSGLPSWWNVTFAGEVVLEATAFLFAA